MGSGSGKRPSAVAPPTYGDITIYLAQEPVDFRLGINGLSTMVEATLRFDPFSLGLFCFTNKRRNQIKVLYCDGFRMPAQHGPPHAHDRAGVRKPPGNEVAGGEAPGSAGAMGIW